MTVHELYDFLAEAMAEFPQVTQYPVLIGDSLARTITVDHPDHSHPVLTLRTAMTTRTAP